MFKTKRNYVYYLTRYSATTLILLLRLYEQHEMYENCAELKEFIEHYNKTIGTDFPTDPSIDLLEYLKSVRKSQGLRIDETTLLQHLVDYSNYAYMIFLGEI